MADITVTAADVRPLPNAIVERHTAGGAINVGDLVYMAADGDVEAADGSAAGTMGAIGVCISAPRGAVAAVAGDRIDVVTYGLVTGFSGMTPGGLLYTSDTAGKIGDAAGTVSQVVGQARTAAIAFINPAVL